MGAHRPTSSHSCGTSVFAASDQRTEYTRSERILTHTNSDAQMDGDPEVEELDSFSIVLPLPYRLAILIVLGVWLWGLNLHVLHLLKIVSATQ